MNRDELVNQINKVNGALAGLNVLYLPAHAVDAASAALTEFVDWVWKESRYWIPVSEGPPEMTGDKMQLMVAYERTLVNGAGEEVGKKYRYCEALYYYSRDTSEFVLKYGSKRVRGLEEEVWKEIEFYSIIPEV